MVQRDDDSEESVSRRLDLYESQTAPLLEYYGSRDRLVTVDGTASPDVVFGRLTGAIDAARHPG